MKKTALLIPLSIPVEGGCAPEQTDDLYTDEIDYDGVIFGNKEQIPVILMPSLFIIMYEHRDF